MMSHKMEVSDDTYSNRRSTINSKKSQSAITLRDDRCKQQAANRNKVFIIETDSKSAKSSQESHNRPSLQRIARTRTRITSTKRQQVVLTLPLLSTFIVLWSLYCHLAIQQVATSKPATDIKSKNLPTVIVRGFLVSCNGIHLFEKYHFLSSLHAVVISE